MKNKTLFTLLTTALAAIAILLTILQHNYVANATKNLAKITINNHVVSAELAITPQQQTKGLMGRKNLPEDQGMLFVFSGEDRYAFWMKNTEIPLDMIWIDSQNKVIEVKTAQPCSEETTEDVCKTYIPSAAAKYVLEVNAGWTQENEVKIGDSVTISY